MDVEIRKKMRTRPGDPVAHVYSEAGKEDIFSKDGRSFTIERAGGNIDCVSTFPTILEFFKGKRFEAELLHTGNRIFEVRRSKGWFVFRKEGATACSMRNCLFRIRMGNGELLDVEMSPVPGVLKLADERVQALMAKGFDAHDVSALLGFCFMVWVAEL